MLIMASVIVFLNFSLILKGKIFKYPKLLPVIKEANKDEVLKKYLSGEITN